MARHRASACRQCSFRASHPEFGATHLPQRCSLVIGGAPGPIEGRRVSGARGGVLRFWGGVFVDDEADQDLMHMDEIEIVYGMTEPARSAFRHESARR